MKSIFALMLLITMSSTSSYADNVDFAKQVRLKIETIFAKIPLKLKKICDQDTQCIEEVDESMKALTEACANVSSSDPNTYLPILVAAQRLDAIGRQGSDMALDMVIPMIVLLESDEQQMADMTDDMQSDTLNELNQILEELN